MFEAPKLKVCFLVTQRPSLHPCVGRASFAVGAARSASRTAKFVINILTALTGMTKLNVVSDHEEEVSYDVVVS